MNIINIGKETEIGGVKIIPIVELLKSQLHHIYGGSFEEHFKVDEVLIDDETDPQKFGVVGHYFDDRVGFSLHLQENWKEFELSCGDASDMMIDQLEMFDQLREWGFKP